MKERERERDRDRDRETREGERERQTDRQTDREREGLQRGIRYKKQQQQKRKKQNKTITNKQIKTATPSSSYNSVVFDPCCAVLAGDLGEPTEDPHQPHGPTDDRRPPDQRGASLHQGVEPPHSRSALQRQRHLRVPHQHQAQADQEGHLVRPRCGQNSHRCENSLCL